MLPLRRADDAEQPPVAAAPRLARGREVEHLRVRGQRPRVHRVRVLRLPAHVRGGLPQLGPAREHRVVEPGRGGDLTLVHLGARDPVDERALVEQVPAGDVEAVARAHVVRGGQLALDALELLERVQPVEQPLRHPVRGEPCGGGHHERHHKTRDRERPAPLPLARDLDERHDPEDDPERRQAQQPDQQRRECETVESGLPVRLLRGRSGPVGRGRGCSRCGGAPSRGARTNARNSTQRGRPP